jgi:TolB protein
MRRPSLLRASALALIGLAVATLPTAAVGADRPLGDARTGSSSGYGLVAFIAHGRVSLVGEAAGSERRIALPGYQPEAVAWSHDGNYLAVQASTSGDASAEVAIVTAAGVVVHRVVFKQQQVSVAGWSPSTDTLAVIATPLANRAATLRLVTSSGNDRTVLSATTITGAAWSPNGSRLAAGVAKFVGGQWASRLLTLPASGGHPVDVNKRQGAVWYLAGWWPDGSSLLAWLDPMGSASLAADGTPLYDVSAHHQRRLLSTMLDHSSWISVSTKTDRIAVIAGGDRELTEGHKRVEICSPSQCRTVHQPAGKVSFDPTYGPDGQLAAVRDRAIAPHRFGARFVTRVEDSGGIIGVSSRNSHVIAGAASGATAPQYGIDGSLLFVRHDGLWLLAAGATHARRLANGLDADRKSTYYGFVPWSSDIAWTNAADSSLPGPA